MVKLARMAQRTRCVCCDILQILMVSGGRVGGYPSTPFNMKEKDYHKPGYWKDWYWNKGGREKILKRRKELGFQKWGSGESRV